jgi:hypothetical protein
MKKVFLLLLISVQVCAQDLSYYLPKHVAYNSSIPTPKSIIGHEVGEWHVTHDKLVYFMKAVAAASNRMQLQIMGKTYEGREQVALIISSPANLAKLETIRLEHLQLSNSQQSATQNIANMPVVVWMGYSIHGNESSGSNASLLAAYYLAAAEGEEVDKLLANTVIIIDPSFNPDGLNRFATWANMHKSQTQVSDPNSREFNEVWPGGRFNHYWFDLNRDWLPAQHVESRNRLQLFHQWKPNILTDHHEMGSNSTFFFQPGVPSRVNPNTPDKNQQLTAAIGNYHAKFLDSIGSFYFTKEGYDDFYYGKGSTYPDINGGVGILFEQASSRGHAQDTENGLLTFPFTIRNQFTTTLSTLAAANGLRKEMLTYQRNFYKDVAKEADAYNIKGFVFGNKNDKAKTNILVEMLLRHQIEIFNLKQDVTVDGQVFTKDEAYVIPTNQQQFKIIKTVFEKTFDYKDSLFYDITSWTMPLALGLQYAEVKNNVSALMGNKIITNPTLPLLTHHIKNPYAYIIKWNEMFAPKILYQLQQKGIIAKVATQQFIATINNKEEEFGYGTIVIPVSIQNKNAEALINLIDEVANNTGVEIFAVSTGLSSKGIDLGSGSLMNVKVPKVMMLVGNGTSPTDVGEIWHLLDTRFKIPVSNVDVERINNISITKYNVIIMPSGSYNTLAKDAQEKLRTWVSNGGTLIATEDAVKVLATNGFTKVQFKNIEGKKDSTLNMPYYLRSDEVRAKEMTGSIFEASIDITHPLCYGYKKPTVSIFKSSNSLMLQNPNPYDSPVLFTENPLQSGYLFRGYKDKVGNTASVNIDVLGRGKVISMIDNLNFRAYWLGTNKIFMNAIFFADLIRL